MEGLRYANIGIAVSMAIAIGGVILFRDAGEGALQAVAVIAFFAGAAVYFLLDEHARRRRERDQ